MWKKIAYGGLLAILIYFLYAVFFKKIDSPAEQMKKEMKAKKVVYKLKDDAIIYADEQIGSDGDKIIKFKNSSKFKVSAESIGEKIFSKNEKDSK
mgnify:CR=1 FL=1